MQVTTITTSRPALIRSCPPLPPPREGSIMPAAILSDSDEDIVAITAPATSQRPVAAAGATSATSGPARTGGPRTLHPRAALSGALAHLSDSSDSDDGEFSAFLARVSGSKPSSAASTRQPPVRARSDTNLVPPRAAGRPVVPRSAIGRSRTTSINLPYPKTKPALKRLSDAFPSGSDSGLSADEDLRMGRVVASEVGASQTKNTSNGRKRPRSGLTEKQRQAEVKKSEREAAQALKNQDRADKAAQAARDRAWQEVNKLRKDKAESMTELQVEVEHSLTSSTGPVPRAYELIKQSIEEDGAEVTVVPEAEVNRRRHSSLVMATDEGLQASLRTLSSVRVIRKSRATLDTIRRTFVPLPDDQVNLEEEKTVFVVVTHMNLLEMVDKKMLLKTLRSFRVCMGYETHQIVLLTYGLDNFFRLREQAVNREYTEQIRNQVGLGGRAGAAPNRRRVNPAQSINLTREELESELIRLRIAERVYLTKLEKEHDLVPWFASMIRDVAIRPYKLLARSHLPICVNPTKFPSGSNARETFELMLRQIPRVTPQFASAIVSHFGSLRAFLDKCAKVLTDSRGRLNDHGLPAASNNLVSEIAQIEVERTTSGQLASHRNKNHLARRILFVFLSLDALALVNT